MKKARGDASPFTPGVDRRDFIRRLGASSATAAVAVNALAAGAQRMPRVENTGRAMLEEMNHAHFAGQIGTPFAVQVGGRAIALELIEARLHAVHPNRPAVLARSQPFSLLFRAPRGTNAPQQIYELSHHVLGQFAIFLVPVGPDQHGPLYEAVFN
jgi:hypothetical protein